jgi:hypothetical protein
MSDDHVRGRLLPDKGDAAEAIAGAAIKRDAVYLAHAPMEPISAGLDGDARIIGCLNSRGRWGVRRSRDWSAPVGRFRPEPFRRQGGRRR